MKALDSFKQCLKPNDYDEIFSLAASYEVVSKNDSFAPKHEIWYTPSSTSFEQLSIVSRDDFADGRINVDLFEISNELRDKLVDRILTEPQEEQFPRTKKNPALPYSKKSIKTKQQGRLTTTRVKSVRAMPGRVPENELWESELVAREKDVVEKRREEPQRTCTSKSRRGLFRFIGRKNAKKKIDHTTHEAVPVQTTVGQAQGRVLSRAPSNLSNLKISHPSDDTSELSYLIP